MAVAFDVAFEGGASSQTSPFAITSGSASFPGSIAANSNRVLIVFIAIYGPSTSALSVTWDSVAMTSISGKQTYGANLEVYSYGLINPNTGSKSLSVSWTGGTATSISLSGFSLYNADQSTGWSDSTSNTATSTSATVTVTNVGGSDASVALRADDNASSATITAGTSDFDERALNGNYGGSHRLASGTHSWTLGSSVVWGMLGVRVLPSSGGPTIALEWQSPAALNAVLNSYNPSIMMQPQPVPYTQTTPTREYNTGDWAQTSVDVIWN